MSLSSTAWVIKDNEKIKYDSIFDSLNPVEGKLPGDKVSIFLFNFKFDMHCNVIKLNFY